MVNVENSLPRLRASIEAILFAIEIEENHLNGILSHYTRKLSAIKWSNENEVIH